MYVIPEELRGRPFHRAEALEAGLTRHVVQGPQFVRLHESVYRHRSHELSFAGEIAAARLALPALALTTGITRLQELGVGHGPRRPLHFVVRGDHHLQLQGVFLHRTVKWPPGDADGTRAEAAWVAYCAESRTMDAIKVGCELLRLGLLDLAVLEQIITEERWRRGVREASWAVPFLDCRCRSMPEAELLTLLRFSGLPEPEVNACLRLSDGGEITPDLWYEQWRRVVEYEGSQHQDDRGQYTGDIDRYARCRREGVDYLQVTKELLRLPKETVRRVHRLLADGGYTGPEPDFAGIWQMLFEPLRSVVRPQWP